MSRYSYTTDCFGTRTYRRVTYRTELYTLPTEAFDNLDAAKAYAKAEYPSAAFHHVARCGGFTVKDAGQIVGFIERTN